MSWWSNFFDKDIKEYFFKFNPLDSNWRVISWNFDLKNPNERQWVLENIKKKKEIIQWQRSDKDIISFFENDKLIKKSKNSKDAKALMNLAIHSTLKTALEEHQPYVLSPYSGATTLDYQNETKYLQWIQASFGTLTRALDRLVEDKSLILTAAVFSGLEPDSNERVLRVIAFNLDITYFFKPDHSLQILIFDDKNLGQGSSRAPTFHQIIKVTKPQFYDEIIKLIHRIASVGEII